MWESIRNNQEAWTTGIFLVMGVWLLFLLTAWRGDHEEWNKNKNSISQMNSELHVCEDESCRVFSEKDNTELKNEVSRLEKYIVNLENDIDELGKHIVELKKEKDTIVPGHDEVKYCDAVYASIQNILELQKRLHDISNPPAVSNFFEQLRKERGVYRRNCSNKEKN